MGLSWQRHFSNEETADAPVAVRQVTAEIKNDKGEVIFQQENVEVPARFSDRAANIAANQYFRGKLGTGARETSFISVVDRVINQIMLWGDEEGTFETPEDAMVYRDELRLLLLSQMVAFNSPVWYNLGVPGEAQQGSACQPYHATVSTPSGPIPIGKLVDRCQEEDVLVNDRNIQRYVQAGKHNGQKEVLRIITKSGHELDVTKDHLVWRLNKFVEASELKPNDQLLWARTYEFSGKEDLVDPDEAGLAGWLQSDSSVGQYPKGSNKALTIEVISVNPEEEKWVTDMMKIVLPEMKINIIRVETEDPKIDFKRHRTYGEKARAFVEKWGLLLRGEETKIPEFMFTASKPAVQKYLQSIFQADGYTINSDKRLVGISHISKQFIQGLQKLLARFGIFSRYKTYEDKRENRKRRHILLIGAAPDRERFAKEIGFVDFRKNKILQDGLEVPGITDSAFKRLEIDRIESLGEMDVYDIQVEGEEYLSNNIVVHNCFIGDVEDNMESISERQTIEARVFKWGSGFGANNSKLRASVEALTNGGHASGPVSFMLILDANAEVVKSAGKRRAAKMELLDVDHPDIWDFIRCKGKQEQIGKMIKKVMGFTSINQTQVRHQNANHSVVVSDDFMNACEEDLDWHLVSRREDKDSGAPLLGKMTGDGKGSILSTCKARDILKEIADYAWMCGDPGLFFVDTVNEWNTVPTWGRIVSCNPCIPGNSLLLTRQGLARLDDIGIGDEIYSPDGWVSVTNKWSNGIKPVYRYVTKTGVFTGTQDHQVFSSQERIKVDDAETIDGCLGIMGQLTEQPQAILDGLLIGDGYLKTSNKGKNEYLLLCIGKNDQDYFDHNVAKFITKKPFDKYAHRVETSLVGTDLSRLPVRRIPEKYLTADCDTVCNFLRGLYSANGSICGGRVTLKATSLGLIEDVQQMLSSVGIPSYYTTNKSHEVEFSDGIYECRESYDLNITSGRQDFCNLIGFIQQYKSDKLHKACEIKGSQRKRSYEVVEKEYLREEEVFDITVSGSSHSFWCNGLRISNCAEFVQPPWSACNLASINLAKFFKQGEDGKWGFLRSEFCAAVSTITVAMDLIAAHGDYPDERIAEHSRLYRPLGIGFSNLGASLIRMGIPYNSTKAREIAAAITAMMSASAWFTSSTISEFVTEVVRFPRDGVINVLHKHLSSVRRHSESDVMAGLNWATIRDMWEVTIGKVKRHGVSNSQVTLLAPTGTISFLMDCETTGVEPLVMLGGVKKMADTGIIHYSLPDCVREYLTDLAVDEDCVEDDGKGNLSWSITSNSLQSLQRNHVLDTALGGMEMNSIHYNGHINMMAAVQPFLSGAISKTVNLPKSVTKEEIYDLYINAWKIGLKSLAVYRDGSKFEQPLNTSSELVKEPVEEVKTNGLRLRLPDTRKAINHKFRIGEHSGYINVGFYPDGTPGEIFVTMAKEGSTVRGLLDWGAVLVSICLQYGVPLEDLIRKFKGIKFEPQGMTGNKEILFAQSPVDYIFRYLEKEYMDTPSEDPVENVFLPVEDAGQPCDDCGSIMTWRGNCLYCDNCDTTTGCS